MTVGLAQRRCLPAGRRPLSRPSRFARNASTRPTGVQPVVSRSRKPRPGLEPDVDLGRRVRHRIVPGQRRGEGPSQLQVVVVDGVPVNLDDPDGHAACFDHYCNGDLTSTNSRSRSIATQQASHADEQEVAGEQQLAQQQARQFQQIARRQQRCQAAGDCDSSDVPRYSSPPSHPVPFAYNLCTSNGDKTHSFWLGSTEQKYVFCVTVAPDQSGVVGLTLSRGPNNTFDPQLDLRAPNGSTVSVDYSNVAATVSAKGAGGSHVDLSGSLSGISLGVGNSFKTQSGEIDYEIKVGFHGTKATEEYDASTSTDVAGVTTTALIQVEGGASFTPFRAEAPAGAGLATRVLYQAASDAFGGLAADPVPVFP